MLFNRHRKLRQQDSWLYYSLSILVTFTAGLGYVGSAKHLLPPQSLNFPSFSTSPERKVQCQAAFAYLNQLRQSSGHNQLAWDERAYHLAVARSKDMVTRNYLDSITPEGTCAKKLKPAFGFGTEKIVESIGGLTHYENGQPVADASIEATVDSWMGSRGYRYNLLDSAHEAGAIGCYQSICTFYGVRAVADHEDTSPCTTPEAEQEYWRTAPKQPGEVNYP